MNILITTKDKEIIKLVEASAKNPILHTTMETLEKVYPDDFFEMIITDDKNLDNLKVLKEKTNYLYLVRL